MSISRDEDGAIPRRMRRLRVPRRRLPHGQPLDRAACVSLGEMDTDRPSPLGTFTARAETGAPTERELEHARGARPSDGSAIATEGPRT
ncbi:MAG: hypothetical protein IT378_13375 [Sandaracinaceae bacterium]|nr:hypothetical protein [Sandaracinaceae bacterium]